jgi:hypothetical protein
VTFEKLIEWGAIILIVILGVRWLGGLLANTGNLNQLGPQIYPMYGYNMGTGVVYGRPMIGAPPDEGSLWTQMARQRGRRGWYGR